MKVRIMCVYEEEVTLHDEFGSRALTALGDLRKMLSPGGIIVIIIEDRKI